jgi:hypothetical protein
VFQLLSLYSLAIMALAFAVWRPQYYGLPGLFS